MLKATADLLTSTFEESLKKLVAPSALIPAIVLTFLHLVLVHPVWLAAGLPGSSLLSGLDDAGRIAAVTVAILAATYIIGSLAPLFLALLSGDSRLVRGGLGTLGRRSQLAARKRLKDDLKSVKKKLQTAREEDKAELEQEARRLELEFHTRFPIDDAQLAPTSLGNILNAGSSSIFDRYRIALPVLWPHMAPVLGDDEPLANRLADEESRVHTLVNLAVVASLVAIEALLVRAAYRDWQGALASAALGFGLAIVFYRASLGPAVAWMDTVEATFDLHRDDLRQKLKLRDVTSAADERWLWGEVSEKLAYGGHFDRALAKGVTEAARFGITASGNLDAELVLHETIDPPAQPFRTATSWTCRYVVGIGVKEKRLVATGLSPTGHVRIADSWLTSIRGDPTAEARVTAEPHVVRQPGSDALLWTVAGLTPGSIGYLSYRLPYCTVTPSGGATVVKAQVPPLGQTGTYRFVIENAGRDVSVKLTLWDARISRDEIRVTIGAAPEVTIDRNPVDGSYLISLDVPRDGSTAIALATGRDDDAA